MEALYARGFTSAPRSGALARGFPVRADRHRRVSVRRGHLRQGRRPAAADRVRAPGRSPRSTPTARWSTASRQRTCRRSARWSICTSCWPSRRPRPATIRCGPAIRARSLSCSRAAAGRSATCTRRATSRRRCRDRPGQREPGGDGRRTCPARRARSTTPRRRARRSPARTRRSGDRAGWRVTSRSRTIRQRSSPPPRALVARHAGGPADAYDALRADFSAPAAAVLAGARHLPLVPGGAAHAALLDDAPLPQGDHRVRDRRRGTSRPGSAPAVALSGAARYRARVPAASRRRNTTCSSPTISPTPLPGQLLWRVYGFPRRTRCDGPAVAGDRRARSPSSWPHRPDLLRVPRAVECGFVPFPAKAERTSEHRGFPACEPCCLDDLVIDFGPGRPARRALRAAGRVHPAVAHAARPADAARSASPSWATSAPC